MVARTASPGPEIMIALICGNSARVMPELPNMLRICAATAPGWLASSGMATNTVRWPAGTSGNERVASTLGSSPPPDPAGLKRSTPPSSLTCTP